MVYSGGGVRVRGERGRKEGKASIRHSHKQISGVGN